MSQSTSSAGSNQVAPKPAPRQPHWLLPVAAIFFITTVAYLPIFRAGFIWDDDRHVEGNLLLRSVQGLQTLWLDPTALPQYYPLTHTFFWIEYHLWGQHPLGYHIVNVLLHICSAIMVWLILRKLGVPGALLAAILFAVHPVNVETAGWISERKNTLSGFFYLLAMLAYLRFDRRRKDSFYEAFYSTSLVLFIASLLCKSVTCTLPAALLLIIWWRDGRVRFRDVVALIPFFITGAVLGLHTAYLERTHVASSGPEWRFAATIPGEIVARFLIAGRDTWFYLSKLLLPYPLMFEYPRWHIDVHAGWQYLFPACVALAVAALFMLRSRIGRSPLASALFFIGTLFPALGFANLYPMRFSFVADHFQYLATIGPLAMIAAGLAKAPVSPWVKSMLASVLVCVLAVLTFNRTLAFKSEKTLYADSIAKNPNGWMTQTNYGVILGGEGHLDDAEAHLRKALQLHPTDGVAAERLGLIYEARHEDGAAIDWFHKAIEFEPKLGNTYYDLAKLLDGQGKITDALEEYALAIKFQHNSAPAHLDYGVLLAKLGRYAEAVTQFKETIRIDATNPLPRRDLIAALERTGQLDEAVDQIHQLLGLRPNDAITYNNLGLVETARHDRPAAMGAFSRALELDPNLTEAREHLDALTARAATVPSVP